jgi:hypothetical protein
MGSQLSIVQKALFMRQRSAAYRSSIERLGVSATLARDDCQFWGIIACPC